MNFIVGAAMALAFTFTAHAQNNRSFVATNGDDSNNCSASAYCRTFSAALAVTNPGGEIVVVNSGGYGPATITQPVVITAIGIDASITVTTAGQNALTINTTGDVTIRGLNLIGGGAGGGGISVQSNGIEVESVGVLRLYNLQIQYFAFGIDFISSGNLALYDSKINDCGFGGLNQFGGQSYVQNSEFDNNYFGAVVGQGKMTIVDSSAHYTQIGFSTGGGTLELHRDRAIFNTLGLAASGGGTVYFEDCLIADNTTAYEIDPGATMAGSNPGTSLIGPGQATIGTLSAGTVIQ